MTCPDCTRLQHLAEDLSERLNQAGIDVHNLEIELRRYRGKVTRLENELAGRRKAHPLAHDVQAVLDHANEAFNKPRKFGMDERSGNWKLTLEMLSRKHPETQEPQYTRDDLITCIDRFVENRYCGRKGYSCDRYPGAKPMPFLLRYCYGDDDAVQRWLTWEDRRRAAVEAEKADQQPAPAPFGPTAPTDLDWRRAFREAKTSAVTQNRVRDLWENPVERVLQALERTGIEWRNAGPDRWISQCPAHDDRSPSLSITEGDDGRALLHCFAGCPTENVVAALGLSWGDLFLDERSAA